MTTHTPDQIADSTFAASPRLTRNQFAARLKRNGHDKAIITAAWPLYRAHRREPVTGEALALQQQRSAEGQRLSEVRRRREERSQDRFAATVDAIHAAMLAAGWTLTDVSESGSRYYSRDGQHARVSDHAANAATQAWIDGNGVTEISTLEQVC